MAVKKKKIKTGGMTLEEAKKKINDPNYNVMSGRIEKDKNVQTGPNKRRITKEDVCIMMCLLKVARISEGDKDNPDHLLDMAGYSVLSLAMKEKENI